MSQVISEAEHLRVIHADGQYVLQCLDDVGGWREFDRLAPGEVLAMAVQQAAAEVAVTARVARTLWEPRPGRTVLTVAGPVRRAP